MEKKKRPLNPQAAKILEQYRNAGKIATNESGVAPLDEGGNAASNRQAPPPSAQNRRSGTRGK